MDGNGQTNTTLRVEDQKSSAETEAQSLQLPQNPSLNPLVKVNDGRKAVIVLDSDRNEASKSVKVFALFFVRKILVSSKQEAFLGMLFKKSGFHGEKEWNERLLHLTVAAQDGGELHVGTLKWFAMDNGVLRLRQRVDLSRVVWYTSSTDDIKTLLKRYEDEVPQTKFKVDHSWPIPDDNRYGFAFEMYYGRIVFVAVDSAQNHTIWKDLFDKCIPRSAVLDSSALMKSTKLGSFMELDPVAHVANCGPHARTPHASDILYLDLCVNNVDVITKDGSFRLDVWVQMVWEDPLLQGFDINTEDGLAEFMRREPELEFVNQIDMNNMYHTAPNSRAIVTDEDDGLTYCQCVRRYSGFMQDLDANIKQFPFDKQDLEIKLQIYGCPIQTKSPRKLCRIVPCRIDDIRYTKHPIKYMFHHGQLDYISELHGLEKNRWDFIGAKTEVYSELYNFLGIAYCIMEINFRVQRKWGYYRTQIYSVLIIICTLVFTNFGFSILEFEQRINLVVALFLAAVAFQFTLRETIPQVMYMTNIDRYLMMTYFFIALCGVNALIVNQIALYWEDEDDFPVADRWDRTARLGIIISYVLYNFYYFTSAWIIRKSHVFFRNRKLSTLKQQIKASNATVRPQKPFTPVWDDMPLEYNDKTRWQPPKVESSSSSKTSKFDSIVQEKSSKHGRFSPKKYFNF